MISVVVPVHNEAAVVRELGERLVAAARAATQAASAPVAQVGSPAFEVLLVDDGSTDQTPVIAATLADVTNVRLARNRGQLGATLEGLRRARGEIVVVLDGDLQDPPEVIPALVAALGPGLDVVYAVKADRHDPAWFLAGRLGYRALLRALRADLPSGAGSYCAMTGGMARRVAGFPLRNANLAAILASLGARAATVPYDKAARRDGDSRVGPAGLVREALGSLWLVSPPGRAWLRRRLAADRG